MEVLRRFPLFRKQKHEVFISAQEVILLSNESGALHFDQNLAAMLE